MSSGIFVIQDTGALVPMRTQTPPTEDQLQTLLANYPDLLAGDQINSDAPRRWLLISREVPLPSALDGGPRWSVDHLFLDQDGIPTLVEVKRAANTQLRREVIGQLLEYAANAVVYWPIDTLRTEFQGTCKNRNLNAEDTLRDFLADGDPEAFWLQVKTNLQNGKVRLLIVADSIPSELRRIVEYLNQQMRDAEVLAVEVRQYGSDGTGQKVLVPLVMGQTVQNTGIKSGNTRPTKQWDEQTFFADLTQRTNPAEVSVVRHIYEWAKARVSIRWGAGAQTGSFMPTITSRTATHSLIAVYSSGYIGIQFTQLRSRPFDQEPMRLELLKRLNQVPGVALPEKSVYEWPQFPVSILINPVALEQFLQVLDWVVDEIKAN
jgi:ribosomal protein L30E